MTTDRAVPFIDDGAGEGLAGGWRDRIDGSDPGSIRLELAVRGTVAVVLTLLVEWVLVARSGVLEEHVAAGMTAMQRNAVAVHNHDLLVTSMLVGGILAVLATLNVNDATIGGQAVSLVVLAVCMSGAVTLGLALGTHRTAACVVMVVLVSAGTWARRAGPRGAMSGVILFIGYFFGFELSSSLGVGHAGGLVLTVLAATAVVAAVRMLVLRPEPARSLRRVMRSYSARARRITHCALDLVDRPDAASSRALHRQLVRLDETALIAESALATPGAVPPGTAASLRQCLFDMELALTNLVRFVDALVRIDLDPVYWVEVRRALGALGRADGEEARAAAHELRRFVVDGAEMDSHARVLLHRCSESVDVLAGSAQRWRSAWEGSPGAAGRLVGDGSAADGSAGGQLVGDDPSVADSSADNSSVDDSFVPAVALRAGLLPGSAQVSAEASAIAGPRRWDRVTLEPSLRAAIQMAVAMTVAIVAGDAFDPERFTWAVLAAVLALVGTFTASEQIRKALYRVIGTLAGIVVGTAVVEAVGPHHPVSVVVVVAVSFIGLYLVRVNYAFMAFAVTVALAQVYVSLGEFSGGLLVDRLIETAIGAGAAIVTVALVVPLRARWTAVVAAADLVDALAAVADGALGRMDDEHRGTADQSDADLRAAGRRVDAAFQALESTAGALLLAPWNARDDRTTRLAAIASGARNYARNLVVDQGETTGEPDVRDLVRAGRTHFAGAAASLAKWLRADRPEGAMFVRSASIFDEAERQLLTRSDALTPTVLALRDLKMLDGALAAMARSVGMPNSSLDVTPLQARSPASSSATLPPEQGASP